MKHRLLLPLLLLLLAGPAFAADHVKWAKTLEAALEEAKERGSMIFIAMVITGEAANDAQMATYQDPAFVAATRDFVCLFCCPMPTEEGEMEVDGKKVRCSKVAPGMTARDHMKAWNDVQKNYAELNTNSAGDVKIPFHFVIDSDGKVLGTIANGDKESGFDLVATAQFQSAFKGLIGQYGKGLTQAEYDDLSAKLAEGEKLAADGKAPAAMKLLKAVADANPKTKLADRARKLMEQLGKGGEEELARLTKLAADDPVAAIGPLEDLAETYAGTEPGNRAKALLAELRRRPEVVEAQARLVAEKEARALHDDAERALAEEDYPKALSILDKLADKFAWSELGKKAAARAAEIRADEDLMAKMREQEAAKVCKGWLSMGRSYVKNGMIDQARAQFRKVIENYPGTSFAAEAEAELKKLR